jgi:hypothetical protein
MRITSIYSVVCSCGKPVEWPDSSVSHACPFCKRELLVAKWPNDPLLTLAAGESSNGASQTEAVSA